MSTNWNAAKEGLKTVKHQLRKDILIEPKSVYERRIQLAIAVLLGDIEIEGKYDKASDVAKRPEANNTN